MCVKYAAAAYLKRVINLKRPIPVHFVAQRKAAALARRLAAARPVRSVVDTCCTQYDPIA